jgi:hypothetical protein
MKRLPALFVILSLVLLSSCGGGTGSQETKAADTAVAVAPPPAEVKPAFVPYNAMMIEHKVKDFDKWKEGYLAHDSVRKVYGITAEGLARDLKDSNYVYVLEKIEDLQKAKAFAKLPDLKKVMMKAGVTGPPTFSYANVLRESDSPIDITTRLMVTHHVKNFESWLKAYDAEGVATRASYGMIDRALARGLVDSNMVTLLFAITDMDKAKARGNSPELKKIMTDAGVVGPPKIQWFRIVK